MAFLPTDVANQALDAIGSENIIGDLEEGTREAQVLLRAYRECLRQLLRAAHWNFARKTTPLTLLADATGQTPNVGNQVPQPWIYEYEYPVDCVKARFVPWNYNAVTTPIPPGNVVPPNSQAALETNLGAPPWVGQAQRAALWCEATDFNYPPPQGQIWWQTQGVSPVGRTVILTNQLYAQLVYTAYLPYPTVWDPLFRAAMVAYLASEVALPLTKDKKFGLTIRAQQIAIAKEKVMQARVTDGNEGVANSDIPVDWMNARRSGGYWGGGWNNAGSGPGYLWAGYDSIGFSDGSVY